MQTVHYKNGLKAALSKLGFYYDPYSGGLGDLHTQLYRHQRAVTDRERASREERDFAAKRLAGQVQRNPEDSDRLRQILTDQSIADSRSAHGTGGALLGGLTGALGGGLLGHGMHPGLGTLGAIGGGTLGAITGHKLMAPMGEQAGRENADELIDLAYAHGMPNTPARNNAPEKVAFLGMSPNELTHIGLRAGGGAAGGAALGAVAGGEDHRLSGALAGGAAGGLVAGGLSAANKALNHSSLKHLDDLSPVTRQAVLDEPGRIAKEIAPGMGSDTAVGGALMGGLPATAAGRAMGTPDKPRENNVTRMQPGTYAPTPPYEIY